MTKIRKGHKVRLTASDSTLVRIGAEGEVVARRTTAWGIEIDVRWDRREDLEPDFILGAIGAAMITTILLDIGDELEIIQ